MDETRHTAESLPDDTSTAADPEQRWHAFAPREERPPGRVRRAAAMTGRVLSHEWTLATAGAFVLAVLMTWPAVRHAPYTLPQDLGDPTLVAWILAWPGHALLTDPSLLWHGNAFHPERWSFAFTDSLLGYAPAALLGDGPTDAVLRYNLIFVFVHALAFLGAYALARQLGVDRIAALVAGLAFAYAPWRLGQAGHLHILSTGGIALALAMLARGHGWSLRHGFRRDRVRPGWIVAGWLVAAWQISIGFGLGLAFGYVLAGLVLVVAGGWLVRRVRRRPRERVRGLLVANLVGGGVFTAVTLLMALPYLIVVDRYPEARRSFQALYEFSPPAYGYLTAPAESWLWGSLHSAPRDALGWPPEMALLPGFALLGLAVAGLFVSVWSRRARAWLAAGVVVTVVLGMGTAFFDGLLYRPLHEHLPGWDGLRTPGRLVVWTTLLLAVLAAGALAAFRRRAAEYSRVRLGAPAPVGWLRAAALVPVLLVALEGLNTTPHEPVPRQPEPLATADGPIMVLPSDQETDQLVMLWTTDRFVPVLNGGSGFTPPSLFETRRETHSFPDRASVSHLRARGVETVVVLPERLAGTPWEGLLDTEPADHLGLTREEVDGTVVFHLDP